MASTAVRNSSLRKIVVVGGHGKVALHFARLASSSYSITSLIRDPSHVPDIKSVGAEPLVLSLEDSTKEQLRDAFEGSFGVLFAAGAGGKGGSERTKKVDYEGALKVFDAIELVDGSVKPRVVLVGALDTRDMSKPAPSHYTEDDLEHSRKSHAAIGTYYEDLVKRTGFSWTILRPGGLLDEPGTGKIDVGVTHLGSVPREDVAATLLALFDNPGSAGLVLDLIQGDEPIKSAVAAAVQERASSFHD
ncbi:hypothetical protein MNV49_002882 [Pseudohyphozyma bogoriensis]|nr:hypothetical protein MNV49_002882 [Pseudohyphozyma bogoriensis]